MSHPHFIIIDAAKSGTTSVLAYCAQHPGIFVSPLKEARFLAYDGKLPQYQGYGPQGPELMRSYDETLPTTWEAYQSLFEHARPDQKSGEASPAYLYLEQAPLNIQNRTPKAKLIAVLRNPVDRAFSSYLHLRRDNSEGVSFQEALELESNPFASG